LNVLRGWLNSTWSAREILRGWDLRRIQAREQANHRAILVLLASELYRREKGSDPPSEDALEGTCLENSR
jgi:hypothetical protein